MNFNKITLKIRKHVPEILTGVGLVGMLFGTAAAIKSTRTVEPILELHADEKIVCTDKSDHIKANMIHGVRLVRHYAPTIVSTTIGAGCIVAGHRTLTARNISLAAGYAALNSAYTAYRDKVNEILNEDQKLELQGYEASKWTAITIDEDGNKTKDKHTCHVAPESTIGFSFLWGAGDRNYENDSLLAKQVLVQNQMWMQRKLEAKGVLWLSEVLETFKNDMSTLPAELVKAGRQYGWAYDKANPALANTMVDLNPIMIKKPRYNADGKQCGWYPEWHIDPQGLMPVYDMIV